VPDASPTTPADIVAYCIAQVVVDELHVHNLLVAPRARGRGLGKRLLALVLDIAARRGARLALLEVRQGNWAALHLYRSLGFTPVGLRRDYYEHPREDALVLRKPDLGRLQHP
jgi:ribosomal-protein-alanine N-acetyltransferase